MKQSVVVVQTFTPIEVREMLNALRVPHSTGISPEARLRLARIDMDGNLAIEWTLEETS